INPYNLTREEQEQGKKRVKTICDDVNMPTLRSDLLIDDLLSGRSFAGSHSYMPLLFSTGGTLFDYLKDFDFALYHQDSFLPLWKKDNQSYLRDLEDSVANGIPAPPIEKLIISPDVLENRLNNLSIISSGDIIAETDNTEKRETVIVKAGTFETDYLRDKIGRLNSNIDIIKSISNFLNELAENGYRTILTAKTPGQLHRLKELFANKNIISGDLKDLSELESLKRGIYLHTGPLCDGFIFTGQMLCFITAESIFGAKHLVRQKSINPAKALLALNNLDIDDLVVHKKHGIGIYKGLVRKEINDISADFLMIVYKNGDRLYLPVYRISQIERYQGASKSDPPLDKLGGETFLKVKKAARKKAMELAAKLLNLYAKKELATRTPVIPADDLYYEFESEFPYDETEDQLSVISDIINDLESERPMDRLVCGDVGFGKTEVALRGAFRVILSGRQVAILVPTTVLAAQHFENIKKRFKNYPVHVGMLSRFRTSKQNTETIKELKNGRIDIIVGTHRLLSKDVHFKKLGLLIIDEEHRFGVTHKERIRSLKASVDTLTMTATPIPRTLNMAFSKLRDLSIISTAPVNRMPVKTMICHDNKSIIKNAIQKELAREGQVYFVHNRVNDIDQVAARISKIVPEARISIGHGQMKEGELEKIMNEFISGKSDILISTAIIESGLDIPRANTIIVDRADTFGLAQLYQIRGRVGRSDRQAFAYLIIPPLEMLSDVSKQRIDALQRYSHLGSGFSIASADLEIRGAGNLLGASQSGNVDTIGYEMYMELLNEAVAKLKGEDFKPRHDPEITIANQGFLPDDYINDVQLKLHYYSKLAMCETVDDVMDIESELVDRFGQFDNSVKNLLKGMSVKALLRELSILGIEISAKKITLHFGMETSVDTDYIINLIKTSKGKITLSPDLKLTKKLPLLNSNPVDESLKFLNELKMVSAKQS
ncbi:MAG: transcription-repair coupling factor, partial [Deltaproteobacteria bacterium]|nr:transcription-repair coupling factor [Deltaproteobacteria bacterium]